MGRAREPLLGRQAEMETLRRELSEAREGRSRFVIITGEAGMGKTRLLEELVAIAGDDGFLTLRGRGSEFDTERPFGLYADALDAYLGSLDSHDLERLKADRLGALAAVFPSLHQLDEAVEYPATVTERFRAYHAVRELLERLTARQPLLLALDDMHWADGASLELTSYLLRNPPQGEVLVAMALRSGQAGTAVATSIGGVYGTPSVQTLELQPLDVDSVKELVVGAEDVDVEELLRVSGGNPFYALQLARSGLEHTAVEGRGLEVPAPVATAIAVELGVLSPLALSVAEAAAVAGDPFDLDLAVAASDRSEDEVLDAIDILLARDLVRETDVPRRFQFRHPVVHRAVYASCPPSVKVASHRRVVEALTSRGAPPSALATHVEQSARYSDMASVTVLHRAAEEAAAKAPTSSVRWLTAALRILPADAPVADRTTLLTQLAASQAVLGRFSDAHDTLEDCLELTDQAGEVSDAESVVRCAEMEQLLGRHAESRARLERAYEGLRDRVSKAGVSLLVALTAASLYLSDQDRMLEWGRLAVEAATGLGDPAFLGAALAAYAMGAAFAGQESLAFEQHDRCAGLVDVLSDEIIVSRLDALSNLTMAELYLDRHVLGCVHGERALELARASGQTHLLPTLTPILGMSLAMTGEMRRSAEVLDDAIEAARLVGDAQGLCMNLFNRELAAVMAGDIDTALGVGVESLELARTVDNGVITAFAGAIHAQALLESGDADAALALLLDSVGGEEVPLLAGSWRAHFLELLTRCGLAVGDHEIAVAAAARLGKQADEHGLGLTNLMAHRAEAHVALKEGRAEDAVVAARAAVSTAEQIEARTHAAASRALLGQALVAAGGRDLAIEQLEAVADEFEALGALRYRDQAEAELRRLGHTTTHRRTTPGKDTLGVESLTGRELEVAELVLDRRTNREIAEELFLSTKTVETHLRNIFNKLGVSSRVEVARALVKAGQTTAG
ncbi:MAG TPA: BREX system ATP-binding domain-containing protein [Acidimicrobiia bacterium]